MEWSVEEPDSCFCKIPNFVALFILLMPWRYCLRLSNTSSLRPVQLTKPLKQRDPATLEFTV
jgi:hypothetical protein